MPDTTDDQPANRPTLGQWLDAVRIAENYSLRQLARASGIPMSAVNRILKDEVTAPSAANLIRLARALNLRPHDVFHHAGISDPLTRDDITSFLRTEYDLPDDAINQINAIIDQHTLRGDAP
ncbi:helix-turn-helix transcriptional regulator [Streptosporangiaceae bacterium NEAU-GS5]|nr:helix-turn-helix transcriptional regulator [Streptosporangiaceae bacterium NEAU-GS5]